MRFIHHTLESEQKSENMFWVVSQMVLPVAHLRNAHRTRTAITKIMNKEEWPKWWMNSNFSEKFFFRTASCGPSSESVWPMKIVRWFGQRKRAQGRFTYYRHSSDSIRIERGKWRRYLLRINCFKLQVEKRRAYANAEHQTHVRRCGIGICLISVSVCVDDTHGRRS